jgi:hypothetical protein
MWILKLNIDKMCNALYICINMENNYQCKGKATTTNISIIPSTFEFLYSNLEHQKSPPYLGDI